MAVPKRRKSKMRVRMRRGQVKAELAQIQACPSCGSPQRTHRVCPSCGMYKGRKVLTVEV